MDELSVALDPKHWVSTSGAPSMSFHPSEIHFLKYLWHQGFFLMRHSAISEEEVDFQEHYVGNFWVVQLCGNGEKQTCGSLQNSIMPLNLDFMHPDQISHMSLNDLRRRFATCDKTQTETQMDKLSVVLNLQHQVSSSGAPMLSFLPLENCFLEYLQQQGFSQ